MNLFTRVSFSAATIRRRSGAGRRRFGFSEYRVVGTYRQPRVVRRERPDRDRRGRAGRRARASTSRGAGINAEVVRRLTPAMRISGRYAFSTTRTFDERLDPEDQATIDRLFPQRAAVGVRRRPRPRHARRSVRSDARHVPERRRTVAARALGGQVGFMKTYVEALAFRRLLGRPARHPRDARRDRAGRRLRAPGPADRRVGPADCGRAGRRRGSAGERAVLRRRRHARSAAIALDSVGAPETISANGFPTGGNAVLLLNGELRCPGVGERRRRRVRRRRQRVPPRHRVRSSPSCAAASASACATDRRSAPIRVDLGFKMDRRESRGTREPPTALHFSLGQAF